MKSILKQVLTVVLLLSVPAVFAAEQKRAAEKVATGFVANAKAKASEAGQYVAGKSKAAYNYVAESKAGKAVADKTAKAVDYAKETRVVKALAKAQEKAAAKFYAHVWKQGSSKYVNTARTGALLAATGALAYGMYKLPSVYRNYVWSAEKKADYELAQAKIVEAKAKKAVDNARIALENAYKLQPVRFWRSENSARKAREKAQVNLIEAIKAHEAAVKLVEMLTPVKHTVENKPAVKVAVVMPAAPVKTGPTAEQLAEKDAVERELAGLKSVVVQPGQEQINMDAIIAKVQAKLATLTK